MSILRQIPSKIKMQRELKKVVFGKHLFCPRCGHARIKKYGNRYHCRQCRKPFSVTSATWLKGMKLSLDTFWLLLWCWVNKVPGDQALKLCSVSRTTQRRWYEKFREHVPAQVFEEIRLSGVVQMDEAYRGGNKRGYAIIGAKEKQGKSSKQRKMTFQVIPTSSVNRGQACSFLQERVVPDSFLNTDGAAIYDTIEKWWRVKHQSEIHSKWEFTLTSEIEGLWGTLTTFIRRMYHHVTREKIEEVLREFQARQMYPEWFLNPSSFLSVSLTRIHRKTTKKYKDIFSQQIQLQVPLTAVSS